MTNEEILHKNLGGNFIGSNIKECVLNAMRETNIEKDKEIANLKICEELAIQQKDEWAKLAIKKTAEIERLKGLISKAWQQATDNVCIEHGMYDKEEYVEGEKPFYKHFRQFKAENNL